MAVNAAYQRSLESTFRKHVQLLNSMANRIRREPATEEGDALFDTSAEESLVVFVGDLGLFLAAARDNDKARRGTRQLNSLQQVLELEVRGRQRISHELPSLGLTK